MAEIKSYNPALHSDANGNIDIEKVKPIIFALSSKTYHGIGEKIGDAWSIGKDIK